MPLPRNPLGSQPKSEDNATQMASNGLGSPRSPQRNPIAPPPPPVEEVEYEDEEAMFTPTQSQESRTTISIDDNYDTEDYYSANALADDDYEQEIVPPARTSKITVPTSILNQEPAHPLNANTSPLSPAILESVEILMSLILDEESSEVIMNSPNEIMFKRAGARYHVPDINFQTEEIYHRVINEYILPHTDTDARIEKGSFLVEGQLEIDDSDTPGADPDRPPLLARVHIIAPPVVKYAKVTIAKKARNSFSLDDIAASGAMTRNMAEFIKACARGRVTMIISGLSGAGKTTMLEAATHHFDQNDRVIVVEDTPELRLPIADTVYMTTTSVKPGMDANNTVSVEWLVRATNRMRPDRIIVGEVRGAEMSEFLVAANSGADGSMTTVHASDPRRTLDKILGLAMKSEGSKNELSVSRDIASTVQIVIQITLIDGKHIVSHIEEISDTIREASGIIATTTIFEYDRSAGRHISRNRPSEKFQKFLGQRGIELPLSWFH